MSSAQFRDLGRDFLVGGVDEIVSAVLSSKGPVNELQDRWRAGEIQDRFKGALEAAGGKPLEYVQAVNKCREENSLYAALFFVRPAGRLSFEKTHIGWYCHSCLSKRAEHRSVSKSHQT
jgi:hypothetical protein